ncbi:prolactin-releasing peptide receptor [Dermatophagoides farinae]|uniref:prolactin-releasing peptide receptor n=1 Tax=Dermatophagoides farinae TaxID=6954 RepID=UPI003F5F578D
MAERKNSLGMKNFFNIINNNMSLLLDNNNNNNSFDYMDGFSIENFEIGSKNLQLCLLILYSITAALALFGNILSIFVLMKGKRSSRDLRLFLVNLSLSDVLMAIFSIPFTYTHFIMGRWIFYPPLCPFIQSIQIVSVFVSIYTLTTIGIDRYIAIMKPFNVNFWTKSFAPIIIVILTWLTGGCLGLMIWFYSNVEPFVINNVTYYDCREVWSTEQDEQIYTVGLFLSVFALPLLCLIFFYGSICYKLWYHCAPGNANAARDSAQCQAKRKVIKMLITIVGLFAICWLPSHVFQLIRVFNKDLLLRFIGNDASSPKYLTIVISSHWLSMAHSFVNPIIYSFMSDNFKADVKYMVKKLMLNHGCCHHLSHQRQRNHHYRRGRHRHHHDDDDFDNFNENQLHIRVDDQMDTIPDYDVGDDNDNDEDEDEEDENNGNGTRRIEMIVLNTQNNHQKNRKKIYSTTPIN